MGTPPKDASETEELLRRAWEMGRAAWPRVLLPAELFARTLLQRLPEGRLPASGLESLVLADLYLACGCVHQVPGAIEALERHYLVKLPTQLGHLRLPTVLLEDVCQQVRIHLLIGTPEAGPRIAEYMGQGSLQSWIRVTAVRIALRLGAMVRETPQENIVEALEAMPAPGADAELELFKLRYNREFRQAVREAFTALSGEQRHLLRLHFIDRLSTSEMAPLFGVNQSTISRWLKSAREAVYEETKRRLQQRLGLSSREFESFLVTIHSQLDLSLSQVLKEEP